MNPENLPITAQLFDADDGQAVLLPAQFHFDGVTEVYVRREPGTGDLVLSRRSNRPELTWQEFMALRDQLGDSDLAGFLSEREQPVQQRDPFADWTE